MATQDELIAEYNRVSAELKEHEAGVEKAKEGRKEIARQLFELNGKGHVYDLGDGVPMIIVASKAKTYFLTPKDKWKKGGRKKKAPTKKVIVHDQVVEVPVEEPPKKGRVIQAEAVLTGRGSAGVVEPKPEPAPVEAPSEPDPDQEEIDALAAALAELE